VSCLSLKEFHKPRKNIISSRSFGTPITNFSKLQQSVVTYVDRAAQKLREDGTVAAMAGVYITTGRFSKGERRYSNSMSTHLPVPTAYTPDIAHEINKLLTKLYKPGHKYKKALVFLGEITANQPIQQSLLTPEKFYTKKKRALMQTSDLLNMKWGKYTLQPASAGLKQHKTKWYAKSDQRSPEYTTRWEDLLEIF